MVEYRRSTLEIRADILCIAEGGARKTYTMKQTNLNHKLFERYLSELSKCGKLRIEKVSKWKIYLYTTSEGLDYRERILKHLEEEKKVRQMEKEVNEMRDRILKDFGLEKNN